MAEELELFAAIRNGDVESVERLLAARPQLAAARDEQGVMAPLYARYRFRLDLVERLLAAGPELDVFAAAALGAEERLRALLAEDPARANARAGDGHYPLGLAAFFGQPGCVKILLARGADVEAVARNALGVRALHAAVASRNAEVVVLLLAAGAQPNVRQPGGYTPLHAAALHGDERIVDLLLAHGADARLRSDDGKTVAALAREKGHAELATRLARD